MRKKSIIQTAPPPRPQPGETILGCAHRPDPQVAHYYRASIRFQRNTLPKSKPLDLSRKGTDAPTDPKIRTSDWLLICDDCFMKFGENISEALTKHQLPIGCDTEWPSRKTS
jgi:hypothetical protein